jgi:hypothetical protein
MDPSSVESESIDSTSAAGSAGGLDHRRNRWATANGDTSASTVIVNSTPNCPVAQANGDEHLIVTRRILSE